MATIQNIGRNRVHTMVYQAHMPTAEAPDYVARDGSALYLWWIPAPAHNLRAGAWRVLNVEGVRDVRSQVIIDIATFAVERGYRMSGQNFRRIYVEWLETVGEVLPSELPGTFVDAVARWESYGWLKK